MDVGAEDAAVLGGADATLISAKIPLADRCLDVALTIIALPVLIIVGAAIALAVYVDSPGPVIYRQRRVGRGGEPFEMLKFRKMRREAEGQPLTVEDDERFTPIGRFLAATRLDELPQVINILRGEMRLVGPRPELECFVAEFADEYAEIVTVTPGLTGNAQLRYVGEKALLTGEDPASAYTDHVMPAKVQIDLHYVRHHSIRADVSILARTVVLPLELFVERLRERSSALMVWVPAALGATLLAVAFIVTASRLP
jgi:lipopolysaccharide/colanic/teichoic acid biosynthesis glycosyltransferase